MQVELLAAWTQLERLWANLERRVGDDGDRRALGRAVEAIAARLRDAADALLQDDHELLSEQLHLAVSEAHQRWAYLERCLQDILAGRTSSLEGCCPGPDNLELWRAHALAELEAAGHAVRVRTRARLRELRRRIDRLGFQSVKASPGLDLTLQQAHES